MYNICKVAKGYGYTLDYIRSMKLYEFKEIERQLSIIEAEERYILQRQLDNHVKLKLPKLINSFSEIYEEFEKEMNKGFRVIKAPSKRITQEAAETLWKKQLEKLRGG